MIHGFPRLMERLMNTSRILVSRAACLTLSLTACGGTEESLTEAPDTGDALVSTEQGPGLPT